VPSSQASPPSEGIPGEGRDPVAWEKLGIEYWNKGYSAQDALDAFQMAINQDPKYDTAMLYGGLVCFYDAEETGIEGDYANAIEWFDKAIEVDQYYAEAWYYRGSACEKLGDYYYSIGVYDTATQYYNYATDAFNTAARLTWRIGGREGLPIKMR
jgi:tetratricopeptide (TPR) repeat protein